MTFKTVCRGRPNYHSLERLAAASQCMVSKHINVYNNTSKHFTTLLEPAAYIPTRHSGCHQPGESNQQLVNTVVKCLQALL